MIFVLIGIALGVAISVGPLQVLSSPLESVGDALVAAVGQGVANLISALGGTPGGSLEVVVSSVVAVAAPGIVVLALVWASRGAQSARRAVAALLVLASLASFLVLPAYQALWLVGLAGALGALSWFATGLVVQVPLMTLATTMGIRWTLAAWGDTGGWLSKQAQLLEGVSGGGGNVVVLWRLALSVVAIAPIVGAALLALDGPRRGDD